MEPRHCKREGCPHVIDEEKRSDAVYHSPECGWKDRNEKKEKSKEQHILDKNKGIIKKLFRKEKLDVSIESLELLEFDIELFTGVEKIDSETKISIVKLFEFQLKFQGGRCQIKKLLI